MLNREKITDVLNFLSGHPMYEYCCQEQENLKFLDYIIYDKKTIIYNDLFIEDLLLGLWTRFMADHAQYAYTINKQSNGKYKGQIYYTTSSEGTQVIISTHEGSVDQVILSAYKDYKNHQEKSNKNIDVPKLVNNYFKINN